MHYATEAELAEYEERGFFLRENVFSETEVEALRDAAENIHQKILDSADRDDAGDITRIDNQNFQDVLGARIKWEWSNDLRAVRSMEPTAHLDERYDALIDDPRIWQPIASINGTDQLSIFSDKLNVKRPGGAPFPWHQEGPYWAYGAKNLESIVTALISIDDGTLENGCLWLIEGSHKHGALQGLEDRGVLGALYTDVDLIEGEAYAATLQAGSVLWFHHQAVHGSQSNRSDGNRRVLLFAYQDAGLPRWELGESRDVNHDRA